MLEISIKLNIILHLLPVLVLLPISSDLSLLHESAAVLKAKSYHDIAAQYAGSIIRFLIIGLDPDITDSITIMKVRITYLNTKTNTRYPTNALSLCSCMTNTLLRLCFKRKANKYKFFPKNEVMMTLCH